jgi:hypothetical protein
MEQHDYAKYPDNKTDPKETLPETIRKKGIGNEKKFENGNKRFQDKLRNRCNRITHY